LTPWSLVNTLLMRVLSVDPDAERALLALAPCALVLDVTSLGAVHIDIAPDAVRVGAYNDKTLAADVSVSGSVSGFLRLLQASDAEQVAALDALSVSGNVGRLQMLQKWMSSVDIDWEELMARRVGDVAAHQMGNFMRHTHRHVRQVSGDMQENMAEYLLYETRTVVTVDELDRWSREVDMLRNDVERLQARINLLVERVPQV
jgi:ubiquinone biosynthesis protein UbiJ